jgi:hypothetical protein
MAVILTIGLKALLLCLLRLLTFHFKEPTGIKIFGDFAKVKERVELYLYFPSGPSWPVLG